MASKNGQGYHYPTEIYINAESGEARVTFTEFPKKKERHAPYDFANSTDVRTVTITGEALADALKRIKEGENAFAVLYEVAGAAAGLPAGEH